MSNPTNLCISHNDTTDIAAMMEDIAKRDGLKSNWRVLKISTGNVVYEGDDRNIESGTSPNATMKA
jgi:hypothetical protein